MGQFDFTTGVSPNWQIDGTLTVGADGTGYDVIFYGGTASNSLTWDASENVLNILSTMKAADDVLNITVADATTLSSGYGRGAYISYTVSGSKSGSYAINGLGIDMFVSEACPTVSALEIYTGAISNKTVGNLYPLSIYCEDIGTSVSNFMAFDIGINSTNLASSRHTGIRIRNHAGTAKSAILIEEAFTDTILRHSPSGVDLNLFTLDNSSGAIFYWDDSEGKFRFNKGLYIDEAVTLGAGLTLGGAVIGNGQVLNSMGHIGIGLDSATTWGLKYQETVTIADNVERFGLVSSSTFQKTSAEFTSAVVGAIGTVFLGASNTQNWVHPTAMIGTEGVVETKASSSGTITGIASIYAKATIADAATVTNRYGLYVADATVAGGKLTNSYGIYIADIDSGATLNYGIYVVGGTCYFGGGIEATTLNGTLTLNGQDFDAGAGIIHITGTGNQQGLTLTNTYDGVEGAVLNLQGYPATPDDDDIVGQIFGMGKTDTGVETIFCRFKLLIEDATNATKKGKMEWHNYNAGDGTNLAMTLSAAGDLWVDGSITLDANETVDGIDVSAHDVAETNVHGGGIGDADSDTKIQCEESSDEDKIRMDVAGTEAFLLEDDGILTLAKQSGGCGYLSSGQTIKSHTFTKIQLNAETFDVQNEFDTATVSGTATATNPDKLEDSNASFVGGNVGRRIWNTVDNTYATVTAVDSSTVLSLSADIMADTETYTMYQGRFTAGKAGIYIITAAVAWATPVADYRWITSVYKNGANFLEAIGHSSSTAAIGTFICGVRSLAATDYLELWVKQYTGGDEITSAGQHATFMSLFKVG